MEKIKINDLIIKSGVNFGTSGIRGLADSLTDYLCYCYTKGFIKFLENNSVVMEKEIAIAGDFRPSTDRMMNAISKAILDSGYRVTNCGNIPTPALIYYATEKQMPSIMITGSHIPDDRNGIKFNKINGEVLKSDEASTKEQIIEIDPDLFDEKGKLKSDEYFVPVPIIDAEHEYSERFKKYFGPDCLKGLKVGLFGHSAVGRKILLELLEFFGAEVIRLEYSSTFIPVDTEAVRLEDIVSAKEWVKEFNLACVVSTDGDSDRPLVSDEDGNWLRGDILGILVAKYLKADYVASTVNCNTALEKSGLFKKVVRTRIGSPYVIAAMIDGQKEGFQRIVAYEGNGGFLTLNDLNDDGWVLKALATRDAMLAILSALNLKHSTGKLIKDLVAELPGRFTFSDRVKEFPTEKSKEIIDKLISGTEEENSTAIKTLLKDYAHNVVEINTLDGARITFDNHEIIHLRPSGNAPELRIYCEADSDGRAIELTRMVMAIMETLK